MVNYKLLKQELDTDPLGKGYAGMSDAQVAASLMEKLFTKDRDQVRSIELIAAIRPADYPTDARFQAYLSALLSQEFIPLKAPNVRNALKSIFAGKGATLAAMVNLESTSVGRAVAIGIGPVKAGHITSVRSF